MRISDAGHSDCPAGTASRYVVPASGARLAACDRGSAGPVVVLLHGGPGCPDYLEPVAQMLSPTVRAVTFDQRGVGGSSCQGSYRLEDYVADVEAVRRHLGAQRVHLLGHSWGGLLAQLYTREHPGHVASLCLVNSAAGVGDQWAATEREVLAHNRRRSGPAGFAALGGWAAASYVPGPIGRLAARRVFARVWRNYFPHDQRPAPADQTWLQGVNRVAAHRTAHALKTAPAHSLDALRNCRTLPVLSLYGDSDIYGDSVTHLKDRFPHGKHHILPECGHLPWLQAPRAFQQAITQFYESVSSRQADSDRAPDSDDRTGAAVDSLLRTH